MRGGYVEVRNRGAGRLELPGYDAGPAADVDDTGPRFLLALEGTSPADAGDDPIYQRARVARPGPVVAVGIRAERLGQLAGLVRFAAADFDAFLAALIEDRIARIGDLGAVLRESAGTGTVAGNLACVLTDLFFSVAVAIVALITFRDDLRARLRATTPRGVPLLTEAAAMIASYLAVERDLGRIAADADVGMLAPTMLGASHLLFADRTGAAPEPEAVRKVVTAVIASIVRDDIGC
jgi:hypothetical protein